MKFKKGTLKEDVTAYGNRFWIQIEDSENQDNKDLSGMVGRPVAVAILDDPESLQYVRVFEKYREQSKESP